MTPPLSDYLAIARREIFAAMPAGGIAPSAPGGATVRTAPDALQLLGTGGRGERRFAVVEDRGARTQDLVRVGDKLGDAEVVSIGWRRVMLRRGDAEEMLTVPADLSAAAPPPAAGTAPRAPVISPAGTTPGATAGSQIRPLGEGRFEISRAEVDHQMANLSSLFTQMRAVPDVRDGKTQGFRLFAIRRGSLFQQLGLLNNDVVQRINGVELTDPAKAMSLFEGLQGETRLAVDVLRGGEARTLSYEIR